MQKKYHIILFCLIIFLGSCRAINNNVNNQNDCFCEISRHNNLIEKITCDRLDHFGLQAPKEIEDVIMKRLTHSEILELKNRTIHCPYVMISTRVKDNIINDISFGSLTEARGEFYKNLEDRFIGDYMDISLLIGERNGAIHFRINLTKY